MIESWTGCYDAGWKGLIADEAFAHPAKFSRNLIGRIYRHMIERGWLAAGMTVVVTEEMLQQIREELTRGEIASL